jgi:PAS domain S-box-containing protein
MMIYLPSGIPSMPCINYFHSRFYSDKFKFLYRMRNFQDKLASILRILSPHPEGMMVKDIAAALGMNRNATAQYLEILFQLGRIDLRYIGKAKIFAVSKRAPFELLAEMCPEYMIGVDRNLYAVDANAGFYAWAGCAKEEIVGQPIRSLPVPLFQQNALEDLARTGFSAAGEPVKLTCLKEDRKEYYTIRSIPVVYPDYTTGSALHIQDITLAETAGKDIALLEERYRALTDAQTEFIVRSLPNCTILSANPAFAGFAGIPCEQLIGTRYWPRVPEEDQPAAREKYRSISPENPEQVIEHRTLAPTGEYRWVRWRHRAIFRDGVIAEVHSHGTDITELKEIQKRLQYYHENAEALVREKTEEFMRINRDLLSEIQKRKETEKNLQKTQFCINNSSEMIVWADEHGSVTGSNKSALSVLGIGPRDVLVFLQLAVTGPPLPVSWEEIWTSVKQNGFILFETRIQDRNHKTIPVEVLGNFFFFDDNETCCFFIRDITERREAEDRLRLLKFSVDNAYDEVFWMDTGANIHYVNNTVCATTGFSREELCAMRLSSLDPAFTPELWERVLECLRKNNQLCFQTQHRCKDGRLLDMDIGLVCVTQGHTEVIFCFARNITEKIRLANALMENDEMLQNTIDAMPDPIYIASAWKFIYLNPAALRLFGAMSQNDLDKDSLFGRVRSDYHEFIQQRVQTLFSDRQLSPPHDMVYIRLDGSEIGVETYAIPIRYLGKDLALVCVRNISERK